MKIVRYRALRQKCRITAIELARVVGVSTQRLGQIELLRPGQKPENPERFILALETIAAQQLAACEETLYKCRNMRDRIFDYVDESEV